MGNWGSLEPPDEILDKLELAISTIESVDDLLSYSSEVRLHRELSPFDVPRGINIERVRDILSNEENLDYEMAMDVMKEEMLRNALSDKNSPFHYGMAAVLNDDDQLIEAFELFRRQHLRDTKGDEFREQLLGWAGTAKKYFDINIFRTLKKYERYHSLLPEQYLTQDFIEAFDNMDFNSEQPQ